MSMDEVREAMEKDPLFPAKKDPIPAWVAMATAVIIIGCLCAVCVALAIAAVRWIL